MSASFTILTNKKKVNQNIINASQAKSNSDKEKDPNGTNSSTKFSYTDQKSQAYLNKQKAKAVIDRQSSSNLYKVPIVETEITQVVEGLWKEQYDSGVGCKSTPSLRKLEREQQIINLEKRLENRWNSDIEAIRSRLSYSKFQSITIEPQKKYQEQLISYVNSAKENMDSLEWKHKAVLEENFKMSKEIDLLKEGINLQNIRYKYYLEAAYSTLRSNSIFELDQRIFQLCIKNLLSDIESKRSIFGVQTNQNIDNISQKLSTHDKTLQNLIIDNQTVLSFLDHDLSLEELMKKTEEITQYITSGEHEETELTQMLRSQLIEKILEIEKFRLAESANKQLFNSLFQKGEDYDKHLEILIKGSESQQFKNHLQQVLSLKKSNDMLSAENLSLKSIVYQFEKQKDHLQNENNLLSEKLNIYLKKLVQSMLGQYKEEDAIARIESMLQTENVDFFLKRRNMEFLRDQNTFKLGMEQLKTDKLKLISQLEEEHQAVETLKQQLMGQRQQQPYNGVLDLNDKSQLQHTIQQLSLILLSKDNSNTQVDQQTQQIIKSMFSRNFDQLMEFQVEKTEQLKVKYNEIEQQLFLSNSKRIEYLNMAFYLSRMLAEFCDIEREGKIKDILTHQRGNIMNFFGVCSSDFSDLIKLANPNKILPVNSEYAAASRRFIDIVSDYSVQAKSQEDNVISDLSILQSMGVQSIQEYLIMRIKKYEEEIRSLENDRDKQKNKTINYSQDNIGIINELKRQRLQDEERYERLSKRLQNFCGDNIFSAGENKDLIGAFSDDMMMALFIQANTIEEMINKTYEQEENNEQSTQNASNKEEKSSSQNNQHILNHSVIEEKPGEEDELEESGKKKGKTEEQTGAQNNLKNSEFNQSLKNSTSSQSNRNSLDKNIQMNSLTSDQKIREEAEVTSYPKQFSYSEEIPPFYKKTITPLPSTLSNVNDELKESLQSGYTNKELDQKYSNSLPINDPYNFSKNSQNSIQPSVKQTSDPITSLSLPKVNQFQQTPINSNVPSQTTTAFGYSALSNYSFNSDQIKENQKISINQDLGYQQSQTYSQVLTFKQALSPGSSSLLQTTKPSSTSEINSTKQSETYYNFPLPPKQLFAESISAISSGNPPPVQSFYQSKTQKIEQQFPQEEEEAPRAYKPMQIQKEEESGSELHPLPKSVDDKIKQIFLQRQKEIQESQRLKESQEFQIQQDLQDQKRRQEIQDLKNFSTKIVKMPESEPLNNRGSANSEYSSLAGSKNRSQFSQHRQSQDREKLLNDAFGQLSEIKGNNRKTMDDEENKSNFGEEHFDFFFGQQEDNSKRESYEMGIFASDNQRKLTNYIQGRGGEQNDQAEGNFIHYKNQQATRKFQNLSGEDEEGEEDEDQDHEDSLIQEAPYLDYE